VAIKAVGFDLDGTLYPAWMMYVLVADLAALHPGIFWAYGNARRSLRKESADVPFHEGWRTRQSAFVAKRLGIAEDRASESIDEFIYRAMDRRFALLRPFAGIGPCLDRLADRGLRLGLLSDLPPETKLKAMGLSNRFDAALCSEDYGALKPASEPFLALAEALGSAPEQMVYVGNKYGFDCAGAKAVGMKTALLGHGKGPYADFVFRSWEKLGDYLIAASEPAD
jgi:putative hydrolase of the HAD superfamily